MPDKTGSAADWLADRALRGLIAGMRRLPYRTRVTLMGRALRRGIGPLVGYRRRAEDNLALIWPEMSADDRRRIAEQVCDNFGRTLIENYSHRDLSEQLLETTPSGDGLAPLAEAAAQGRPVIFVTGHFGNHEVPRHVLTRMGHEIGGLYRPMANPYFNAHYARTMTSWGGPVFAQGAKGTMGFARHLRAGGMGTLLFDVNADDGVPLEFLGQPAMTATSAADLAIRFDALVLPYFARRLADGFRFDVTVEAPIPAGPATEMTQAMNDRLAARVRADPGQWFWVHRRWKDKRGRIAAV